MVERSLAVIGAGPKAAAIAAKAYCMNQVFRGDRNTLSITVFERNVIGSAWDGNHGYTDGDQPLCTQAERDLGFPYVYAERADVARSMMREFSWSAFLLQQEDGRYSEWVDRGRRPPSHREYVEYLRFAFDRSGCEVVQGNVLELSRLDGRWSVLCHEQAPGEDGSETEDARFDGFDGVVFTGPGPASVRFKRCDSDRIYDGHSFWLNRERVLRQLSKVNKRVVIIGGGGTTAATAAWLVRNGIVCEITLLNSQGTLYARSVNFFENRLFADEAAWRGLSKADRRTFSSRLNRGVVWETVTDQLSAARNILLVPGKATLIRPGSNDEELIVDYKNALGEASIEAEVVIDAAGFDPWWFVSLLPTDLRHLMAESPDGLRVGLEERMREDLSFDLPDCPGLHAPMHSQIVGPGFATLMALGGMADRVLKTYL